MDQEFCQNNSPGEQENIVAEVQQAEEIINKEECGSVVASGSGRDLEDEIEMSSLRFEQILPKTGSEEKMEDPQESDAERMETGDIDSTESEVDHLKIIPPPPPDGGYELNYKKTVRFCSDSFDSDEDYHNITKTCEAEIASNQENARTSSGEKEAMFNQSGENDSSAILCCEVAEVVEEIIICAVLSSSTSDPGHGTELTEAANQQSNCRENDSSGEHLINTADGLSPAVSADRGIEERQSHLEPDMTQDCSNTKTAGLLDWLQAKETEVNAILEEVKDCQSQHNESEQELQNLLEELADIDGLKSEFQVNTLNELTANILRAPDCFLADGNTPDSAPQTDKKSKPEKNRKSKSAVKSPLLRRKEIKTCLNLHRACEDSEVLQELLIPAVRFGSSVEDSEATTSDEAQLITESIDDIDLVDPDTKNVISSNSVRPGLSTMAIFHIIFLFFQFQSLSSKIRRGGMSWFPWKTASFLLLISTAAIISADMERSGGRLNTSNIGQFLSDIGQYDRVTLLSQVSRALPSGPVTVFDPQAMMENYKGGKDWADKTLPLYVEQLQPYYLLAQEKAAQGVELVLLGYQKLGVLATAGLDKLEEIVPGARKQIDQFLDFALKCGQAALMKTQMLGHSAKELALDIAK